MTEAGWNQAACDTSVTTAPARNRATFLCMEDSSMFNDFQVSLKTPLIGTDFGDFEGRIRRSDLSEDEVAPTFLKPFHT